MGCSQFAASLRCKVPLSASESEALCSSKTSCFLLSRISTFMSKHTQKCVSCSLPAQKFCCDETSIFPALTILTCCATASQNTTWPSGVLHSQWTINSSFFLHISSFFPSQSCLEFFCPKSFLGDTNAAAFFLEPPQMLILTFMQQTQAAIFTD